MNKKTPRAKTKEGTIMDRIYLSKENAKFVKKDTCRVDVLLSDGNTLSDLEPRRLFPVSDATKYITLLDTDNKEKAIIKDLADLALADRLIVEECLREYYLVPKIVKVLDRTEKFGILKWTVLTDRGEVTFAINNRHSDIKIFFDGRVIVRDTNDNRYEIENWTKLDHKSRVLLGYDL